MEKEIYKGLVIEYSQDSDPQSPEEWGNEDVFLVAFHRDFAVDRDGFSQGICQSIANKGHYEDDSVNYEAMDIMKKYHIFGLEAYIHSGVVLALSNEGNFCDRQWDVSQLGLVFVSKKETRLRASAKKLAISLIKTWNMYLGGEVYGYTIKPIHGELDNDCLDSCWGFYGFEAVQEGARDKADYIHDQIIKKHEEKKRAEIRNRVPLSKRTSLRLRV